MNFLKSLSVIMLALIISGKSMAQTNWDAEDRAYRARERKHIKTFAITSFTTLGVISTYSSKSDIIKHHGPYNSEKFMTLMKDVKPGDKILLNNVSHTVSSKQAAFDLIKKNYDEGRIILKSYSKASGILKVKMIKNSNVLPFVIATAGTIGLITTWNSGKNEKSAARFNGGRSVVEKSNAQSAPQKRTVAASEQ